MLTIFSGVNQSTLSVYKCSPVLCDRRVLEMSEEMFPYLGLGGKGEYLILPHCS